MVPCKKMKKYLATFIKIGGVLILLCLLNTFYLWRTEPVHFSQMIPEAKQILSCDIIFWHGSFSPQTTITGERTVHALWSYFEQFDLYPSQQQVEGKQGIYRFIYYAYNEKNDVISGNFTITDLGRVEINNETYEIRPWDADDGSTLFLFIEQHKK